MSLSLVHSRALLGLEARPEQVEVHLANGLPSFTLVGLADTEVKEARERVRSAIANAGLTAEARRNLARPPRGALSGRAARVPPRRPGGAARTAGERPHPHLARGHAERVARFQLIAAMNPCPCGYLGHPTRACRGTPDQVSRHQSKFSGPLLDRIDLHVDVPALPPNDLLHGVAGEPSDAVRARVVVARERALTRHGQPNQALAGQALDQPVGADPAALKFLNTAAARLGWSARSTHRASAWRVARGPHHRGSGRGACGGRRARGGSGAVPAGTAARGLRLQPSA